MTEPRVLVVIPARGGSKGIPRKNLRSLAGRPLIGHAIETALASRYAPEVVVSSDDPEILSVAGKLGARPLPRDAALSGDATTLDEVVVAVHDQLAAEADRPFDVVVTLQPTSPLLSAATLDEAIDTLLADLELETLLSARDATHLSWTVRDGRFVPAYEARLNRQQLEPSYRETGGLILCRPAVLRTGSRIGSRVSLITLSGGEAIDIDSREDWALCEWYLSHRDVLFVVAGYPEIGLGHVHNALTLANELVTHRVRFLVTRPSRLAQEVIAGHHYEVHRQRSDDLVDDIRQLGPDVVINDRLDTDAAEIERLQAADLTVINFEDLGSGARVADLVVNAIYPEADSPPGHYFGPRWFCLRQEFILTTPRPVADRVGRILVTFGGTDPNNLTARTLAEIHDLAVAQGIELDVVAGRGYAAFDTLARFGSARVVHSVADMADRIRAADLVVTSAGRTVFEVASLGTPAVVVAQNERELTHFFASIEHGFVNLGLGRDLPDGAIRDAVESLIADPEARRRNQGRMLDNELRSGTSRVVQLIEEVLDRDGSR